MDPIAGDSFKGKLRKGRYSMKKKNAGRAGGGVGGLMGSGCSGERIE